MRSRTKAAFLLDRRFKTFSWIVAGLAAAGCRSEREATIVEQQSAITRLDATTAELQHLEQEHLREQAHVEELSRRVESLRSREDVLATEAADLTQKVTLAEEKLKALKERAAAVDAETKAAQAKIDAADPAKAQVADLEARLKALTEEAAKLAQQIEAIKK